jgi:hypothetical protein
MEVEEEIGEKEGGVEGRGGTVRLYGDSGFCG